MNLTIDEVQRFYNIWFPLLHYVNQKRNLVPSFPSEWRNAGVQPQVAVTLRDALWADERLREAFMAENPARLSEDDLALVESWKYRVAGDFFVLRYLKNYTVFLSGDSPGRGYGVLGLTGPIEEILGPYLPIYVKAVLLPFGKRIIFDSLLSSYRISFGGGYRSSLKDTYRDIQEREGIVTTLLPDPQDSDPEQVKKSIRERNKKILTAFQKALGQAGLSPKMMEEHTGTIADFAQEWLLSQEPPCVLLDMTRRNVEAYLRAQRGKVNLVSLKRFVQFLRDTDRMDFDQAEDLLDFLKHERRG